MSNSTIEQQDGMGLGIAAMVLGILSLVFAWLPFLGLILAALAFIFGLVAIKKPGRGMAIAGIVTGSVGILLGLLWLVVFMALPSLQRSQEDSARKNDIAILSSEVANQMSMNKGALPAPGVLTSVELGQIVSIGVSGPPSMDIAVYSRGYNCSGVEGEREYAVSTQLANGEMYCLGS